MRLKGLCLALLLISGCDRAPDTATEQSSGEKAANPALGARWQYPREREIDGRKVIVHAPQIRTWDRFEHFTAQVAIESLEKDATASYGVLDISGDTVLDRQARLVKVAKPKVDRVTFSGGGSKEKEDRIRAAVEREPLEIPLDVFLYYLADGVLESAPPAGFSQDAPPIHVVESPAFLLFVNGKEVNTPIGDTGLEIVGNANFPTFRDAKGGKYYLLTGEYRYSATKLAGPWTAITDLPASFGKIPARGEFASLGGGRRHRTEGRFGAGRHHDLRARRDHRARRQAARPGNRGHGRARVDREYGKPAVPSRLARITSLPPAAGFPRKTCSRALGNSRCRCRTRSRNSGG